MNNFACRLKLPVALKGLNSTTSDVYGIMAKLPLVLIQMVHKVTASLQMYLHTAFCALTGFMLSKLICTDAPILYSWYVDQLVC